MGKKILVYKGASRYNVLRSAADSIMKGFESKGYQVDCYDGVIENEYSKFSKFQQQEYAFVFGCQACGVEAYNQRIEKDGQKCMIPYIGWCFDNVLWHGSRILEMQKNKSTLLVVDEKMIEITKIIFPNTENVYYLPHGGFAAEDFEWQEEMDDKDIDVLFPGTIDKLPLWEDKSYTLPIERYIAEETITCIHRNPELSVIQAMKKVFEEILNEPFSGDVIGELGAVYLYVERYIRAECRNRLIDSLLESGIEVHFVGEVNDEWSDQYKKMGIYEGKMDISEVTRLMRRSKIVINPFPVCFEKGYHERIFTSFLQKAICMTPFFQYLYEHLGQRVEYIDLRNIEGMTGKIKDILINYQSYSGKIEDNYHFALLDHTWKNRGEQIVDWYEAGMFDVNKNV